MYQLFYVEILRQNFQFHILQILCSPRPSDNGATDSLKEQEQKWTDLGIQQLQESPHHTGN